METLPPDRVVDMRIVESQAVEVVARAIQTTTPPKAVAEEAALVGAAAMALVAVAAREVAVETAPEPARGASGISAIRWLRI